MFGMVESTLLKKDILEYLVKEHRFVSTRELSRHFSQVSQSKLKNLCKELYKDIEDIYPNQEIALEINQHYGYRLISDHTNLSQVYYSIFSQEIEMDICARILDERSFSTEKFCDEFGISESQLRRRIKNLNVFLEKYGLKITVAKEMKIKGREIAIRYFHFMFLFFCYTRTPSAKCLNAYKTYLHDVDVFIFQNNYVASVTQKELLGMMTYIIINAVSKKQFIEYSKEESDFLNCIEQVKQPEVVSMLPRADWNFFILFIYVWGILDIEVEIDVLQSHKVVPPKNTNYWIDLFEEHRRKLNPEEKEYVYRRFFRHKVISDFFYVDNLLVEEFMVVDYDDVKSLNPYYWNSFIEFWDLYEAKADEFTEDYFKMGAFLTYMQLIPFDSYKKHVRIYFFCDLTVAVTNYHKERIRMNFLNRYDIEFVSQMRDADVLVSMREIDMKYVQDGQYFLEMNGVLNRQELMRLERVLRKV